MSVVLLASFSNSRIKPRPSTTQSLESQLTLSTVNNPAATAVMIRDYNGAATYALIENFSSQFNIFYITPLEVFVDPTVVPTAGQLGLYIWNRTTNIFYVKIVSSGIDTNWAVFTPQEFNTRGQRINPFATASLDTPELIFAMSDANFPLGPGEVSVVAGLDLGQG